MSALRRADEQLGTALVTGACSGIGRALARRLGSLGYRLVLVSQRPGPLAETASGTAAAHGVAVHPVVLDLARAEAAAELEAAVDLLGIEVDLLVNNAGMFFFGEVADAAPERAAALLQLHVVTPSLLCLRLGRRMRERRRGQILIVSSISAFRDFPGIAFYGASKKYLLGFARSLRSELGVYGVNVTCVAPGAVATGLYDPSVVDVDQLRRPGLMADPEPIAEAALAALFAGQGEVVPGLLTRAMVLAASLTPQPVIDLLRRRAPWLPGPERRLP